MTRSRASDGPRSPGDLRLRLLRPAAGVHAEEFPVLKHALGEEVFDAFAVGYLQQYPSRSYTLFQLAANFPNTSLKPAPTRTRPRACRRTGRTSSLTSPDSS